MTPLRNGALLGVLAVFAVATWLLGRQETPVIAASEASAPRTFYMRDTAILGTDPSGYVSYRVFAKMVEQPGQDQPLVLNEVRVEYETREKIPWLVTAVRATLNEDETMQLNDARLTSLPEPGADALVIETDELDFDAETYLARSQHPVVLSRGDARVEAQSFRADLKQDQITLENGHGRLDH
ncbi:MAG TPA: LPS export ABC transporter periplasmic protein LptC [Gammaproteobacteria bacterium]|jgi:LPS export ABC transporter protein LptC